MIKIMENSKGSSSIGNKEKFFKSLEEKMMSKKEEET
jgi:hypothetical protein